MVYTFLSEFGVFEKSERVGYYGEVDVIWARVKAYGVNRTY